ncbi:hypothetical protein KDL44_00130 [bacterium]|nr:hypothetical protein [bacterium]
MVNSTLAVRNWRQETSGVRQRTAAERRYRLRIERRLVWEQGPGQELRDNAAPLALLGISVVLLSAAGIGPYLAWLLG